MKINKKNSNESFDEELDNLIEKKKTEANALRKIVQSIDSESSKKQ